MNPNARRQQAAWCGGFLLAPPLIVLGAAAGLAMNIPLAPELRAGVGFFLFFVAPGLLFLFTFFPHRFSLLEVYPLAIALSLGVWSFPGLLAYQEGWGLEKTARVELLILVGLAGALIFRHRFFPPRREREAAPPLPRSHSLTIVLGALLLAALCLWTGAFRGLALDWDYFNYISHVNKLLAWDRASLAHFAYADAPPDPIHSYNIWALQWALIGRLTELSAVELYLRTAFLTAPAAALAFYSLGRRIFAPPGAGTLFLLFAAHQVLFGGLLFLGTTTFFPDDSQWLLVFPAVASLYLRQTETPSPGLALGTALAALGLAITHVLWGLCFYVLVASDLLVSLLSHYGAGRALQAAWQSGRKTVLAGLAGLFGLPLVLMVADCAVRAAGGDLSGRTPLFASLPARSPFFLFLLLAAGPAIGVFYFVVRHQRRPGPGESVWDMIGPGLRVMILGLVVALPYTWLRWEALGSVNWEQFGRNPYRAFLWPGFFFLNPFQRSLQDPNMTFYPLYFLSYAVLFLGRRRWGESKRSGLVMAILVLVPLVCFHPALATMFAEIFSLGYLRRFLRLGAVFCYFPLAGLIHGVVGWFFRGASWSWGRAAVTTGLAGLVSAGCIPFPGNPPYFTRLLEKTVYIMRHYPRDSLLQDDTPYRLIAAEGWFRPEEVLFSDMWTSFRLTAYLPQFAAVQHKPGVGVKDQDERMQLLLEFFDQRTSLPRMRQILGRFHAAGVIINRNPSYLMGSIPCAFPEAITRLKSDPAHFQLLYDQGDWAVFRVKSAE